MADEQKGTEYIVLRRDGGHTEATVSEDASESTTRDVPESFVPVGSVTALNDVAAIKAMAKESGIDLSRGAVAVPARSWRVRTPQKKVQETTLWT